MANGAPRVSVSDRKSGHGGSAALPAAPRCRFSGARGRGAPKKGFAHFA